MRIIFPLVLFLITMETISQQQTKFIGHRGCRGTYPENTIEGFKKAIAYGADGIEWDIIVNKNNEIIISHEPYVDTTYCQPVNKGIGFTKQNLYEMSTDEIKLIDCGSKFYEKFPNQEKVIESKPLLKDVERELLGYEGIVLFEIKSEPSLVTEYYPNPKEYADIIYNHVKDSPLKSNYIYMSFDPEILNELYSLMSKERYVLLEYKPFKCFSKLKESLNFTPHAFGLNYKIITPKFVNKSHKENIEVFAWTVNEIGMSNELVKIGVDAIITDYPDLIKHE